MQKGLKKKKKKKKKKEQLNILLSYQIGYMR